MELLFWNMGKNDNAALALECMRGNGVSIAAFAEHSGTEFSDELLRGTGYRVLGLVPSIVLRKFSQPSA